MHLIRVLVGYDRDNILHAELRLVQPRVIFPAAPDNHGQHATGLERLPNVAHGGAGHHEEHRPEAREREVVRSAQVVRLYVCLEERGVAYACVARFLRGGLDEVPGAVDPESFASRSDGLGDPLRAVSEPASNVQYARTFGVMVPGKRLIAMLRQTIDQQMSETTELVEQDSIPGLDDDLVFPSHATLPSGFVGPFARS